MGKSLYTVLDRLEDRQLITKRRSKTDARRWVYCLPHHATNKVNTTKGVDSIHLDTPPPSHFSSRVELKPETTTGKELEISQQQFNIDSTVIQHPKNVDLTEKAQTVDDGRDTEVQEFIQHTAREKGERGCVEQTQSDDILQIEPGTNSSTTQQDTSSQQTKSLDSTSGQKAFNQKYQPVEVLSSEGEWVKGYYVHKCLVVANLERIERKWSLYDERGEKYIFLGQIRVSRVE